MSTIRSTASGNPAGVADDDSERGTALIGTLVGFTIFFVLLLFGVQVLLRLYATSSLTAAAYDAAREVAQSPSDQAAEVPVAQASAVRSLGTFGAKDVTFNWVEVDGQQVVLQVRARSPQLVPVVPGTIVRTVTVRTERFR